MAQVSPKVYISYAYESDEHNEWVRKLAERLRGDGVDAILDQWAIRPGDHIQQRQDQWVRESEAIGLVLTDWYLYRTQIDSGVAFEFNLIEQRVEMGEDAPRLIPIDRALEKVEDLPSILAGRFMLRFRTEEESEASYSQLLDALLGRESAPALGNRRGVERLDRPAVLRRSPVRLRSLYTTQFRALKSFELSFRPPAKRGRGQWALLLGENGVGKSSFCGPSDWP